jgi:hypothetical protein
MFPLSGLVVWALRLPGIYKSSIGVAWKGKEITSRASLLTHRIPPWYHPDPKPDNASQFFACLILFSILWPRAREYGESYQPSLQLVWLVSSQVSFNRIHLWLGGCFPIWIWLVVLFQAKMKEKARCDSLALHIILRNSYSLRRNKIDSLLFSIFVQKLIWLFLKLRY